MIGHAIVDLRDHPHNACRGGKLEWFDNDKSVYSVKAGYVAVVGYEKCIDHTFPSKADAIAAINEVSK